jgi:sialidase-1
MTTFPTTTGLLLSLALGAGLTSSASARPAEVTVFDDDVDGHADEIRIPSIVRAPDGSLLAFAERRIFGDDRHDFCDIDVVMKKSTDGGRSWSAIRTIDGTREVTYAGTEYDRFNTYHNLTAVVDDQNDRIYIFYTLSLSDRNRGIDPPGIKDRILMRFSNDNGDTWSLTRDLTADLLPENYRDDIQGFMFGPGHGVTVHALGREQLVVPLRFHHSNGGERVTFIYKPASPSTSGWKTARKLIKGGNEVVVETLGDGENLYFNMRDQSGGGFRHVFTLNNAAHASDPGWWDEPQTFESSDDRVLTDPKVHASVLRVLSRFDGDDEDMMLFANPALKPGEANHNGRRFLTIRRSLGETDTTVKFSENKLLTDRFSAYSDMVKIDANTNGILYETGGGMPYEKIVFTRFSNDWVKSPRIANWTFDGLPEGRLDASWLIGNEETNAFHGKIAGTVQAASNVLIFGGDPDGNSSYVYLDNEATNNRFNVDAGESFEIRARFATAMHGSGGPGRSGAILSKDTGSGDNPQWWLRVRDGKAQFAVSDGTLERIVTSDVPVSDNRWHSVSAKRDAASNRLILTVDGDVTSIADGTGSLRNGENVAMGNFNHDGRQFIGAMNNVEFYFYK